MRFMGVGDSVSFEKKVPSSYGLLKILEETRRGEREGQGHFGCRVW